MNFTEFFCLESKGCQVPLAVSIVSCFPSPSCVFLEAAAPVDLLCFSGFTDACPQFAPPQQPAQRGWRGPAVRAAPLHVPTPAHTDVSQGKQQRKHSGCISEQGSCPVGTPPSVSLCGAENFSLLVKRGIVQKKIHTQSLVAAHPCLL